MFCLHFRFPFDHGLVSPPCEDGWFSVRPYFWGLFWRPYSLGSSKGKSLSFINLHRHELGKVCSQPGSFSKGQGVLQGKVKYRLGPNLCSEKECAYVHVILLFDSFFRYGIEFQVIDMRWGQRDESTDDHQTMTICLEEVCSSTRNVPYLLRARIFKIKYVST